MRQTTQEIQSIQEDGAFCKGIQTERNFCARRSVSLKDSFQKSSVSTLSPTTNMVTSMEQLFQIILLQGDIKHNNTKL